MPITDDGCTVRTYPPPSMDAGCTSGTFVLPRATDDRNPRCGWYSSSYIFPVGESWSCDRPTAPCTGSPSDRRSTIAGFSTFPDDAPSPSPVGAGSFFFL